jgi:hypothetical protein
LVPGNALGKNGSRLTKNRERAFGDNAVLETRIALVSSIGIETVGLLVIRPQCHSMKQSHVLWK